MKLSENGSVVVIDDKVEEALPIIKALSKNGISTVYYSGNDPLEIPEKPLVCVRVIFLDLQLLETVTDEHQISATLISLLQRIISSSNGPYILIIWSKKLATYGEYFQNKIKKTDNRLVPSSVIFLDKADCLEEKEIFDIDPDNFASETLKSFKGILEKKDHDHLRDEIVKEIKMHSRHEYVAKPDVVGIIERQVAQELEKAGVLHLFLIWENLIKRAAVRTVSEISSIIEMNDRWESNMKDIFRRMGKARTGKNNYEESVFLKESVLTLVHSFCDRLETEIKEYSFPDYIKIKNDALIVAESGIDSYVLKNYEDGSSKAKFMIEKNEKSLVEPGELSKIKARINAIKEATDKSIASRIFDLFTEIPGRLNTSLLLEKAPSAELIPGNLYVINVQDSKKKENCYKTYFKDESIPVIIESKCQFIELEISPVCDWAQKKWKKSRLLSGVLFPSELLQHYVSKDHFYLVAPEFWINGTLQKMVFDMHLFKSLDLEEARKRKPELRMRRDLLVDILAKVSSHINRPGVAFVE